MSETLAPISPPASWAVAELSVVPQGEEFLVGDPMTGVFVQLPAIGVDVLGWLGEGQPLPAIAALAGDRAGEVVDVGGFVAALESLGFAQARADDGTDRVDTVATPRQLDGARASLAHCLDVAARAPFGRLAWSAFATAATLCAVALFYRPALVPHASDILFLSSPALSLAALTGMTYVLAAAHECAHWLAARAVGVRASITINRRLYFLVFATDLTGRWSVPRRQRWRPILAGMARATRRDVRVARWYRWIWLVGMAGAAWFFGTVFVPTTAQTGTWVGAALWPIRLSSAVFWQALALGVVVASPLALTAAVLVRDVRRFRRPRAE